MVRNQFIIKIKTRISDENIKYDIAFEAMVPLLIDF